MIVCANSGTARSLTRPGEAGNIIRPKPSKSRPFMPTPVEEILKFHAELREIRHDIHAHPELGFEEDRTSEVVAGKLAAWGIEVHRGLARTGVVGVVRGGPAHRAGLQPGDVIVSIDGRKITEAREALLAISSRKPGDQVKLEVLRDGKSQALVATAIERPARPALTE